MTIRHGYLIAIAAVLFAAAVIAVVMVRRRKARKRICPGCQRAMLPSWNKCMFCGWQSVARLEFIHGPLAGQTMPLTEEVTTLGSVAGNTVVLADPAVSKKHAGIRHVEGRYELADLGSTNGIYVNGHKVPTRTLEAGDVVRVGNTEAIFKPS